MACWMLPDTADPCGSRLPGSATEDMVNVAPSTTLPPDLDDVGPELLALHPDTTAAVAATPATNPISFMVSPRSGLDAEVSSSHSRRVRPIRRKRRVAAIPSDDGRRLTGA